MTNLKDQRKSVRKRMEALSDIYRSIKNKESQLELGNQIIAKLDELGEFCMSKGFISEKKKKDKKEKKSKDSAGQAVKKLEPSKDLFNESPNSQPEQDETGNY